jgi:hypothetical protein
LQRKDRDAARTLRQYRVAGGNPTMACQSYPGGHRRTGQGGSFLEGEVARHAHDRLLAQHRVLRQHPVEIGTEPVGQIIGLDRAAEPPRMEATGNSIADLDPRYPVSNGSDLTRSCGWPASRGATRYREVVPRRSRRSTPLGVAKFVLSCGRRTGGVTYKKELSLVGGPTLRIRFPPATSQ